MKFGEPSVRGKFSAEIILGVVALFLLCGCAHTINSFDAPSIPRLAPGVTIDSVAVGNLTVQDAQEKLKQAVIAHYGDVKITLKDPDDGGAFHYGLGDFGGYFDVKSAVTEAIGAPPGSHISMPLRLNSQLVRVHVDRISALWRVPLQEPRVNFSGGKIACVTLGHDGRSVNEEAAMSHISSNLPSLIKPSVEDDIRFEVSKPQVSPDHVTGLADTIVSYTTTFNPGNVTRTNNLLLAVKNINGTVVGPGEVFSYNDSVGPRTQQTGFRNAIIYVNNRMKKDVGGGICQASSTLYNCVLLANLQIVERHAHSLPVHYVPAGRDATVAWGGDDFRFRNNTPKPIIIRATTTPGGTLTESLIGDRTSLPHPTAQVAIDVTPQRTYPDGFAVSSYRVVKEDGVLIAKDDLGTSFYHNLVGGVPH